MSLQQRVEFADLYGLNVTRHAPSVGASASFAAFFIWCGLPTVVSLTACIDKFPTLFTHVSLLAYAFESARLSRHLFKLVVLETVRIREYKMTIRTCDFALSCRCRTWKLITKSVALLACCNTSFCMEQSISDRRFTINTKIVDLKL